MQVIAKTMTALVAVTVLGTAGAAWAVPTVSNVSMTQRQDTRLVDISYTLADEAAIVTLSIETNDIAIPDSAVTLLYGDVCKVVQPGSRAIVWDAGKDWPENVTLNAKACVTAWRTNAPPLYCAVDVSGGSTATNYPVYYYASSNGVLRGVTDKLYKNDRILLRRLTRTDPVGFQMGEYVPALSVILTKNFYAGVFQVTQGQWAQVMDSTWVGYFTNLSSRLYRPVELVSYLDIRENPAGAGSQISPNWPQSAAVGPNSFMGRLRSKTGLAGFDLPTEAQWEYACRAGTTTYYNDGLPTSDPAQLNELGRYKLNGGYVNGVGFPDRSVGPENATAIVGSYRPNAWGLYDMHGNIWEWCLDWFNATVTGGEDPLGPSGPGAESLRVVRGGDWSGSAGGCRSASRSNGVMAPRRPEASSLASALRGICHSRIQLLSPQPSPIGRGCVLRTKFLVSSPVCRSFTDRRRHQGSRLKLRMWWGKNEDEDENDEVIGKTCVPMLYVNIL